VCVWHTGLPSAGKSTIANALELQLFERNAHSYVIDSDNIHAASAKKF
jgi:adenylylsulfate kinase